MSSIPQVLSMLEIDGGGILDIARAMNVKAVDVTPLLFGLSLGARSGLRNPDDEEIEELLKGERFMLETLDRFAGGMFEPPPQVQIDDYISEVRARMPSHVEVQKQRMLTTRMWGNGKDPYSTQPNSATLDWWDAGVAQGPQLLDFCGIAGGAGNTTYTTTGSLDPTSGDAWREPGSFPKSPPPDGYFRYIPITTVDLDVNEYFRATLSWDGCTPAGSPAYVGTDMDLVLTKGLSLIAASASYSDNNEGFQVQVSTAGTYTVSLVWAMVRTACDGTTEPWAYAHVHGSLFIMRQPIMAIAATSLTLTESAGGGHGFAFDAPVDDGLCGDAMA